jgi:hypothetical protein
MKLRSAAATLPLLASLILFASAAPAASAQTQLVTAQPGYINLGMTTSIAVTAPSAGTYAVVVEAPGGGEVQANYVFTAAGQTQNETFGNSTTGFKAAVDQAGTYNVFVESNGQALSSTSFYATNKLVINLEMVQAGTCVYVQQTVRGVKFIPKFVVTYASNGALMTDASPKAGVTFTNPDHTIGVAQYTNGAWAGTVDPNWNFTYVGNWSPSANATDGFGNTGNFTYLGSPFVFMPATLSTAVQLVNPQSGQVVTGLYNGESVNIQATVTYPPWTPEPIPGFAGPLNSTRGGVVVAVIGYGFYNSTTGAVGSSTNPVTAIDRVQLTYSGSKGLWMGSFNATALPTLPVGTAYEVVVNAMDSASPPNMGSQTIPLPNTTTQGATTTTTTTQTVVQAASSVPSWAYAAMGLLLLVGAVIGYVAKRSPSRK